MSILDNILKHPFFNIAFSFLLGVGIIAIFRPLCKGPECEILKAPPIKEWDGTVYRIGGKCWEFKSSTMECPNTGEAVESFRGGGGYGGTVSGSRGGTVATSYLPIYK